MAICIGHRVYQQDEMYLVRLQIGVCLGVRLRDRQGVPTDQFLQAKRPQQKDFALQQNAIPHHIPGTKGLNAAATAFDVSVAVTAPPSAAAVSPRAALVMGV